MTPALILALCLFPLACKQEPPPEPPANLERSGDPMNDPQHARTIEIAKRFASEQGRKVDSYRVTSVKPDGANARVRFERVPAGPGTHFAVVVDTQAGKGIELIPGR